jgi:hypothetical protein
MSFLGFIGKTLIGGVTGFVTGGPAGAVIGATTAALTKSPTLSGSGVPTSSPLPTSTLGRFPTTTRPLTGGLSLMGPGGAIPGTGTTSLPGSAGSASGAGAAAAGGACPPGYHPSKSSKGILGTHPCVRNRHMNVTNPKALRRALRRAYGFEKLAMRTIRLIHPRKKASFGGFKRGGSRRSR